MSDIIQLLSDLKAIDKNRLKIFYPRVRDRDDIKVLRDSVSEVIVLSRSDHINNNYYQDREEKEKYIVNNAEIETPRLYDNVRRAKDFGHYIRNKRWLDFGCGLGGMLDEIGSEAAFASGLEPNEIRQKIIIQKGYHVFGDINEIEDQSLDVITLFHVLEHLLEPVKILKLLKQKLKKDGFIIIEVPHARDVLFTLYDCEKFKQFTFWSEHLVLHTKESLKLILDGASLSSDKVQGDQRYPLSNHLYWLSKGEPGGHEKWPMLESKQLEICYKEQLKFLDMTDTLIAISK